MNILYFVHGFPPSIGVAAINSFIMTKHLAKYGHNILVLSPGVYSKTSTNPNFIETSDLNIDVKYSSKLMKIPLNLIFSHFENMFKFITKLRPKFSPNLILSQYNAFHFASVIGGYVSKLLKIPHVIRSHDIFLPSDLLSLPLELFFKLGYTRIFRSIVKSNRFYVTTSEMKRYFLKLKKLRKVDFRIHHNGININEFYPFKNQEQLKTEFGCDNILLFIGTISYDYGIQNLLNVLPDILRTHKETHFIIIGGGSYTQNLLNLIKSTKLNNQVHYLGIKPHGEMPFYINNCDIGIGLMAFKKHFRYTIPVKCLEYMACRKPFITAPCSTDLIKNNDVGLLLKRDFKKKDLFDNLISLIEDKALRTKLAKNGIKKINEKFRWEKIMGDFNKDLIQTIKNF